MLFDLEVERTTRRNNSKIKKRKQQERLRQ